MLEPRPTPVLIGREAALTSLRLKLDQARDGAGSRIAIIAESGLGKTRLLQQFAAEAIEQGMLVVALSFRGSILRPYQPMTEVVQSLLGIDPELRRESQRAPLARGLIALGLERFEPAFARLLRIEGSAPSLSPASAVSAAELRPASTLDAPLDSFDLEGTVDHIPVTFDLPEMLAILLREQAAQFPGTLLILDDLDEAAEISYQAALRLVEEADSVPVMVVAGYTPVSPGLVTKEFTQSFLRLEPLTREETMELAASLLAITWITSDLGDLLWNNTGGNPLLIRLLVEHLYHTERIGIRDPDKLGDLAGEGPIPAYQDILVRRIRILNPELVKTLLYAVVLGDGFRLGALGALHEKRTEDELAGDLDALVEARFLERAGAGRRAIYRFPHALVRDTLYATAPQDRRTEMHTRAGEYYSMPTPGRRLRTEYAVYHFTRANLPQRALAAIDLGIAQAQREGDEAMQAILEQQALTITASDPDLSERRNHIAETLGDQVATQGDYAQAALAYQQADSTSASAMLLAKCAMTMLAVDAGQAVSLIARLAPGIPLEDHHDLRWRLEAAQSWGLALQGRTYDAIRHSRNSLATLSTVSGLGSARTLTRGILGMALYYHGDEEEARPHLESSRAGYDARGDAQGVTFLDQILSGMPREAITHAWLDLVLRPLLPEFPDQTAG